MIDKKGVLSMNNKIEEKETQRIFSDNLKYYLKLNNKTQLDLANAIGVSNTTINNYVKGYNAPRMDKVDKICKYLGVSRSDLMEERIKERIQNTENQDISIMVDDLMNNLNSTQTLMYKGEPMDEVTKELVRTSIEQAARIAMVRHKESKIDD
jgi:transcriptional regulator with XRE-family HTH domain